MSAPYNGPFHPVVHCSVDNGTGAATSYQTETNWTVRDEFAAKALAALIGREGKEPENRGAKAVPILAQFAYEYADAMMAAREVAPAPSGMEEKKGGDE